MRKMPEGQLCQAKDERGIVKSADGRRRYDLINRENACTHPASIMWSEGTLAMVHGAYAWWCECCALDAQIKHAEERAKELENLRAKRLTACMA